MWKQLIFLLFVNMQVVATDSLVLIKTIPIRASLFSTDPTGNIYLVKDQYSLIKYSVEGDSIAFFNEIKKGKIRHIDATNPMRILLLYSNYNQIVILDHLLSKKSTLLLNKLGFYNVNSIANSADGNIWIYDPMLGALCKIDEKPSIKFETNLRNVIETALNPVYIVEQDRNLFLIDTTAGIYRFDQYGLYKTKYQFLTKEMQYFNEYIVYYTRPYLYSYHTQSFREEKMILPFPEDILQVRVERKKVYILRKEKFEIYQLD